MLGGEFQENSASLRFMGDMGSLNTALRDPVLFRIKKERHYRQGDRYLVWPSYDFNTPIVDSIKGVTDAIRSKEYELRDELYYQILELLNLRKPRLHEISRFAPVLCSLWLHEVPVPLLLRISSVPQKQT